MNGFTWTRWGTEVPRPQHVALPLYFETTSGTGKQCRDMQCQRETPGNASSSATAPWPQSPPLPLHASGDPRVLNAAFWKTAALMFLDQF